MKKVFLFAAMCLAGITASQAQHFTHGLGVGLLVENVKSETGRIGFTFIYSPRFNFAETENTSLSIGIPISAGFTGSANADRTPYGYYDDRNMGYVVNVPLIFNFNIGAGAVRGSKERMGFFAGGGYAYHARWIVAPMEGEYGYLYDDVYTKNATGPTVNIGLRIGVGRSKRHNIEIRASYMRGVTDSDYKPGVYGGNCLFNF